MHINRHLTLILFSLMLSSVARSQSTTDSAFVNGYITNMHGNTLNVGLIPDDVIELVNCEVSPFSQGFAVVKFKENGPVLMDARGNIVIQHDHIFAPVFGEWFKGGYLLVNDNVTGKIGIINTKLELVVPCKYELSNVNGFSQKSKLNYDFENGRCILSKRVSKTSPEEYFIVEMDGSERKIKPIKKETLKTPVHPFSKLGYSYEIHSVCPWNTTLNNNNSWFPDLSEFENADLAPFKVVLKEVKPTLDAMDKMKNQSLIGFCDSEGNVIIQPKFEKLVSGFREGYAVISFLSDFGRSLQAHINSIGNLAYSEEYTLTSDFCNGIAYAEYVLDNQVMKSFINVKGEKIGPIDSKCKTKSFKAQSDYVSIGSSDLYEIWHDSLGFVYLSDIASKSLNSLEFYAQGQRYHGDFSIGEEFKSGGKSEYCCVVKLDFAGPEPTVPIALKSYGLLNLKASQILIPPAFSKLSDIDEVSGLSYAEVRKIDGTIIKGFVNQFGIFKFLMVQK